MARQRKPTGSLKKGPFTASDVAAALRLAGGAQRQGGNHPVYETADWKIPVSNAWTGLRKGCPILKGIARTMGITDRDLLFLLNGYSRRAE